MKKIWFAAVACGAISMATATATSPGLQWVYQYLLATSWTERELAPVTERIIKDELPNTQISDVAAEVLLARMGDGQFPLPNKLRLIRVLGADESGRYDALLKGILDKASNSEVRKEAKSAIAGKPGASAYVPGSIDIRAIVNDMDAAALAAKPTSAQAEHLSQFPGGSIDELFEWAGRPQQIVSGQTRVSDGILIHVKIQRISFFYRGIGRVVYGYNNGGGFQRGEGWLFQAIVADPLAFETEFSYRERAKELGMPDTPTLEMTQLVSGYTASTKNVVETNYRRESRPLEFMDTAAEILATQFKSADDPVTVDMYAWICRLLTMHGGQRYAALLQRVASETPDAKLKRFAELPIEKTTEVPAEPYVPGTISLAAQRAKYPSLYPESTFQSGRL